MPPETSPLPPSAAHAADALIQVPTGGIASRVVARNSAGNVTLFAMDDGQEISEHTTPFDALALVLEGVVRFTIGGHVVDAGAHEFVRLPAHVPHALRARAPARFVLVMLREAQPAL